MTNTLSLFVECVNIRLRKLGCKCLTALLTVYRNKAKRPPKYYLHIIKTKDFTKFFSCNALNSTISNVIPMPSCLYPLTSSVNACPAWAPASMKTLCKSLPEVPLDTCKGPENIGRDYITTYLKQLMNLAIWSSYVLILSLFEQKYKVIVASILSFLHS